ncbi:MAG: glycerophosphodiester phosphodiesterase [Clostridia bacterium]|nr:glycerophosphodiester phosphodiesterase [Clostridia bacterium]
MTALSIAFYRALAWILSLLISVGLPLRINVGSTTVTAHSGCMGFADNSIEAMEAGVRAGANIIEFDLNFTRSGEPVLSHDEPNEDGVLVSPAEAFCFLSENKSVLANVDVKSTLYLEKLVPLAEKFGVTEQLFMTGLDENGIAAVKEKCPGIPYYLNVYADIHTDVRSLVDKALDLGAVGLNLPWENASRRMVRLCHHAGLLVSVWTVDETRPIIEMALIGVDNITTRCPDLVSSLIR